MYGITCMCINVSGIIHVHVLYNNTVESPNIGHFGTSHFVCCGEVVLFRG